jgi:hypothetical protein
VIEGFDFLGFLGMRELNGLYCQGFNRRYERAGHLFQGRFKGILVEKESYLIELCRYVVLNPVRAHAARSAREWRWSNYRATAGLAARPGWLNVDWTLAQFAGGGAAARRAYRRFVAEGAASRVSPWEEVIGQLYLGTEKLQTEIQRHLRKGGHSREIVRMQRNIGRPSLDAIVSAVAAAFETTHQAIKRGRGGWARMAVAYLGRLEGGLRLRQIGEALHLDIGRVSHLARDGAALREKDRAFHRRAATAMARIETGRA